MSLTLPNTMICGVIGKEKLPLNEKWQKRIKKEKRNPGCIHSFSAASCTDW